MKNFVAFLCVCCVALTLVHSYPQSFADSNRIDDEDDIIDLSPVGPKIFGEPDSATGLLVAQYNPQTDDINPEELGNYAEGDMLMPRGFARNGLTAQSSRWPNGQVPFEIRGNFDAFQMNTIEQAIQEYHRRTCIRFVPRTTQQDYVSIVSGNTGCWSSVGRIGGKQEVNLQVPGCLVKVGTVIHELMHACGFMHEQNRSDRDGFITINWSNIKPGTSSNFDKASASSTNAFGVDYDYGSVMHYSANAFSKNGQPTIAAKRPVSRDGMGQRDRLAPSDITKLGRMYKCNGQRPSPAVSVNRPQPGLNNGGFGSFFNGIRPNWSSYPQQANSFISQLVSYFFRRNPRQNDAEYTPNAQSNGYGFSRGPNQYNSFDNNYNYPNNNFNRQYNGGGGGYGFQG